MENKYWILITILGAVWGSAFMFIKIATPELGPIALVNIRLAVAGLIFIPFLLQEKYLKHFRSNLKNILVLSIVNTALPFRYLHMLHLNQVQICFLFLMEQLQLWQL